MMAAMGRQLKQSVKVFHSLMLNRRLPGGQLAGGKKPQRRTSSSPKRARVCVLTFVVEAVDAVDGGALVVPPQKEEVLRVLDLVGQQQADGLQRLLAAVHVVAEEQVVGLGREAAILEKTQQIRVLPVDVT